MNINYKGIWMDFAKHHFDENLASELSEYLQGYSVIDLGCGDGRYTKYFISKGIDCIGYDGNPNTPMMTDNVCKVLDLSENIDLNEIYDYVLCLEVGEHIPKEYEDVFINNLHKLNTKGVILSWAVVGQVGDGHINCRNNEYIRNKFNILGYKSMYNLENIFRCASKLHWFKNTIMVFEKNKKENI